MNHISEKKVFIKGNGYYGYTQPISAVAGCNDTGTFSDSPCPSNVAKSEIESYRKKLRKLGIRSKLVRCSSTNIFCQHIYVCVHPENKETAFDIAEAHMKETRLFYSVN